MNVIISYYTWIKILILMKKGKFFKFLHIDSQNTIFSKFQFTLPTFFKVNEHFIIEGLVPNLVEGFYVILLWYYLIKSKTAESILLFLAR